MNELDKINEDFMLLPGCVRISPGVCRSLWRTRFDVSYYAIFRSFTEGGDSITPVSIFFLRGDKLICTNLDGTEEIEVDEYCFDDTDFNFQIPEGEYKLIELHCPEILI